MGLAGGAVLGFEIAACQGKGTAEQTLFRTLYRHIQPGDMVLADALHCTWWTIIMLHQASADIAMPRHRCRQTHFSRSARLGEKDHRIKRQRPQWPKWMDVETHEGLPEYLRGEESRSSMPANG